MHNVNIGSYTVGPGQKPFIICEISANHNGSLEKALQLINAAIETGCDAIKRKLTPRDNDNGYKR